MFASKTVSRARFAAALLAGSLILPSLAARAQDYYVDARIGSDTNVGDADHPFRTLLPLLRRLTSCDNAYVRIAGAANDTGVGRYSHPALPSTSACRDGSKKP